MTTAAVAVAAAAAAAAFVDDDVHCGHHGAAAQCGCVCYRLRQNHSRAAGRRAWWACLPFKSHCWPNRHDAVAVAFAASLHVKSQSHPPLSSPLRARYISVDCPSPEASRCPLPLLSPFLFFAIARRVPHTTSKPLPLLPRVNACARAPLHAPVLCRAAPALTSPRRIMSTRHTPRQCVALPQK